ncbi:MAG: hypothetical protein ACW98K_13490 [Candidatus Kariarchaeaceae archaeon]|jgi:hypothetical protein
MKEAEYLRIRKSRILRKRGANVKIFDVVNVNDIIFVAIAKGNKSKRIVAEFEVDSKTKTPKQVSFHIEPIYHSPPNQGILMNDLLIYKLSTYTSIATWKNALKSPIIKISEHDYQQLSRLLMT